MPRTQNLTANERFFDALVRHQVGLQRLSPGVTADVLGFLAKSEEEVRRLIEDKLSRGLSAKRLEGALRTIQEVRDDSWMGALSEWNSQLIDIMEAEPAFIDGVLTRISPTIIQTSLPPTEQIAALIKTTPFEGRVFESWAEGLRTADLQRIEDAIKIGLTQGATNQEIANSVLGTGELFYTDGAIQITKNQAFALTRTAVTAITNAARADYFSENEEYFDGELFVAVLDSRTTIVCASHDGQRYPADEGPVPPLHWNCRSQRVPVLDGEAIGSRPMKGFTQAEILDEFAAENELEDIASRDDLPRGMKKEFDAFARTRVRELTGSAPASLTYQEFLERQSARFQDEVLGPTRGKLFREQGLTLDKFVNRSGDLLTLKQLQLLDLADLEE